MATVKDNKDFKVLYEMYGNMKTEHQRRKARWDDISKFTGIQVDTDYFWTDQGNKNGDSDLDTFIDDPTAAISVNQQADYMVGIMWGTGDKILNVVPSRYVKELAPIGLLDKHFSYVTEQVLFHMNHSEAGFHTALKPYSYDQASFGTSGIGTFPNPGYKNGQDDNALIFRSFGIDNMCIDEGANSKIDRCAIIYHWTVSRIISEFVTENGKVDTKALALLPKPIQTAYKNSKMNDKFDIVYMMVPRDNFDPKLKGKRGARYRGVWFMDSGRDNAIFHEESYVDKPISVCRQIKIRGDVYGRSSGTMLSSSIRSVNFMVGTVIEILEKMSNPSLGMFNSAIFGDSILDGSPNGLTIFNQAVSSGGNPVFPLYEVGDPSAIIKFLIPYLNEKITTAFKIDVLLDFSSAKAMTATESLQRYNIRGKSLSGMLIQQKIEMLEPTVKRAISILDGLGELGINAKVQKDRAEKAKKAGQAQRIIPDAVLQAKASGKPWYEIKFNNELEKLTRTEAVQNLLQVLQAIEAIAGVYPDIIEAVDFHKLLSDINDNLDYNNQIVISADDFKAKLKEAAEARQAAMALQAAQAGATVNKDKSIANKNNVDAQNANTGQLS